MPTPPQNSPDDNITKREEERIKVLSQVAVIRFPVIDNTNCCHKNLTSKIIIFLS